MSWRKNSYKHALASKGIRSKTQPTKMFERLDTTSKIKTQTQAEINYILFKAKVKYGETQDISKAYFLLPDGTFLADREFCGGMHDNIDVEGIKGEFRFNYITGSISIVPQGEKIYLRIYGKPSGKQMTLIKDYSKTYDITVELLDCFEDDNDLICNSEGWFDLNNNLDIGRINIYFNSGIKGQGHEKVMRQLFGTGKNRVY
jgi:hypothetical protein